MISLSLLLRLYISGTSTLGVDATNNLKKIVQESKIPCNYEIIDILKNPEIASQENILATPLLLIIDSTRTKRIVGDLSDKLKILSEINSLTNA